MNFFGKLVLAFAAGMLFGYYGGTAMQPGKTTAPSSNSTTIKTELLNCLSDASKRQTDSGVRLAMNICQERYK